MSWPRRAVLAALGTALTRGADSGDTLTQDVQYIWPVAVWQVDLFSPSEADNEQDAGLTRRLAAIAEEGYESFLREILPAQLEGDPTFRAQYEASDATTRNNEAFLRWQKMSFARQNKVRLDEVNWIGPQPANIKGMRYTWPELHSCPDFKRLIKNIQAQSYKFLKHISSEGVEKGRFRTFVWAEIYRPGDFDLPHVHTGAMVAGMFAAGNGGAEESRQTLSLADVRGVNAPFGHRHDVVLDEGELIAFPAWAPHYFRPHPGNETNVYFGFLMWPPGGAFDFDWEDDPLGDYTYRKSTQVKRAPPPERTEL